MASSGPAAASRSPPAATARSPPRASGSAFSVNDWTAFVIFITVIGGIGTIEGPIVGTVLFFLLRETLADLGSIYLMILGLTAIVVMLKAPRGIWGYVRRRFGIELFPLHRLVRYQPPAVPTNQKD